MTFQGRSATFERPCMILPIKSKEIHQRFGDHKTLMNVLTEKYFSSVNVTDFWQNLFFCQCQDIPLI